MRDIAQVALSDDYLLEIGKISVGWSSFESILDLCLMKLSGGDIFEPRSWVVFAHMAFPMKMDILGALISELQATYPRLNEYPKVRGIIQDAQRSRNKFVHSKWGTDPETGKVEISNLSARGTLKTDLRHVPIEELKETVQIIGKASVELYKLVVLSSDNPPRDL